MGRGQLSIFKNLFEQTPKQTTIEQRPRNYFMPERDQLLAHRFYFYAELKFYRLDKCKKELEREFFITEARLEVVLRILVPITQKVVEQKPTIKELELKFPWMNWRI